MASEGAGGPPGNGGNGRGPRSPWSGWPGPLPRFPRPRIPGPPRSRTQAILYWTAVAGIWGLILCVAAVAVLASGLPDTSKLYDIKRQPSISYLDRSGALLAVRGSQYAPPVDLDSLPPYVPAAVVAIEDRRFFHHFGVDPVGIARAMFTNLRHGHVVQGGSTLTQQLAKNLFLTPAQTPRRKAQELVLALWLEAKFSKKEILALYLNRVYFGDGAFSMPASSAASPMPSLEAGLLK